MTDQEAPAKTPEQIAAEAAAAQGASAPVPGSEAPVAPAVAPEPALAPVAPVVVVVVDPPAPVAPAPEVVADPPADSPDEYEDAPAQVANPNALRGIPAGPPPHPRSVNG